MGIAVSSRRGNDYGISNYATASLVTDAVAAVAQTFDLGFEPRIIRFRNVTDRISDEWYSGMVRTAIYAAIIGITAKLDADSGVTDTNYTALWTPVSMEYADMRTAIIGINAKLDADAGVTDTNYGALWNPSDFTVAVLQASIAGLTTKLDNDAGVTDTNYNATWVVATSRSLHTIANGTVSLELTHGITVLGTTFTVDATTMVASKQFAFEALG